MVSAIPPAGFAIVEALIQLFWSLSLGFLVLAMVLAAPFFWLEPVLVFLYSLARQTLYLLFSSVGLSFFVGLINAFVFGSLSKGSAGAVMITAGLGGVMLLVFGWYALKSVGQAFVAISGAVTAGRLSAQEHLQGWTTAKQVAQAPGQATAATVQGVGKATDAAGDTYKKVLERKLAFDTARPGTSSHYAAAYALGDVPALAHVGALARSMGYQMPDEIRRGLYARQTAGRQDPRSERAVRAIDRDAKVLGGTP
jgi:hypothetical protein